MPLEALGRSLDPQSLVRLPFASPIQTAAGWEGVVQYIDRFGNAATTIPASVVGGGQWTLALGKTNLPGVITYGNVAPGDALALVGSHGFVEIAVNQGSAQQRYGLAVGDRVVVTLSRP